MRWPEMPTRCVPDEVDTDEFRLGHILDAAKTAAEFIEGKSRSDLDTDEQLTFALCKLIENAGEATRHVWEAFRKAHPEVPWDSLVRAEDDLIAALLDIDRDMVWKMVTERLPEVVAALEKLLPSEGAEWPDLSSPRET